MATTLEDALAMVRECRDSGVKLGTGFELRHHPGHVLARDLISSGTLGPVGLAQGQWGRGVRAQRGRVSRTGLRRWWEQPEFIGDASVMMGLGGHAVDLMRFLLGQEVTEVSAITDGQTEQQPLEHLATMLLRFSGGTIASVCCGRFLPDTRNNFTVYSTDGSITGTATLWEARIVRVQVASESVNRTKVYPYDYLANFISELEDFQLAIKEDRESAATGLDGLRVTQVTSAMVDSARTGRTIKLEPLLV